MTIAIVTPWYQHPELANDYTQAVSPELHPDDQLIIVDNGDAPDLPCTFMASPERNLGFAAASNLGMLAAETDAVLFLNNDVALGQPGWLDAFRDALEPGVLAGWLRAGRHADVDGHQLPYLDGWCLAGMRADLLELGGFDERLEEPAYFSDNLLCLEARAAGMSLRGIRVRLRHKENVTAGPASSQTVSRAHALNHARYTARARDLLVVT